ncbi:hypothetical protein GUF81_05710, partial [Xanthomonas citri pv. citri]|nr:hypothetical protein [Xanthomonas citri pv. citri]
KPGLSTNAVRSELQNKLPVFMHPAFIEKLDSLPLSPNGKLDRGALPKPVYNHEGERPFLPPSSKMEQILADIWKEVLGAEKIGTADSFFELGGDSIK